MVTDTFFDLQRFADDILVGDGEKFVWQGGSSFGGDSTINAPVGSTDNPTYLSKAGNDDSPQVIGTVIHLTGTEQGYSFAINETKNDWEVANIQGKDNIIVGDFSAEDGVYEIDGNVDIKAFATSDSFTENVNGQSVAVKATGSNPVTFNIAAENGSDEFTYTFSDSVDGVMVNVDDNDTAVFTGKASNVTFNEGFGVPVYGFSQKATVSNDGDDLEILTGNNVIDIGNVSMTVTVAGDDIATVKSTSIDGISSVVVKGVESITDYSVNGSEWGTISGSMDAVKFEVVNDEVMAHITNTGAVVVDSAEGQNVAFEKITTAATEVNGATITGLQEGSSFAVELAGASKGFTSIAFDDEDPAVKVAGVQSFKVINAGASYTLTTNADDITFDGNAQKAAVKVKDGSTYTVDGVDAEYSFESNIKESGRGLVTINDANVTINNNNASNAFEINSTKDTKGINTVDLVAGDDINVSGDDDGYSAVFKSNGTGDNVTLNANGYELTVDDDDIGNSGVTMIVGPDDDDPVTVKGLKSAVVTIPGTENGVYQFNDDTVSTSGSDLNVTLDSAGNVADIMDADTQKKLDADNAKWNEIATLGSGDDTVKLHHGKVYDTFYSLENSGVANQDLAAYSQDDDSTAETVSGAINITGNTSLGSAKHVTLEVGDGAYVGQVPINVEENESDSVVDVTINMANSRYPSTVVVGTQGEVTATHKITLSDDSTSDKPSYGYLGQYATGNNVLQAGGAAMLRHDGEARSSILGGSGSDSILAGKNDVVKGNGGADLFYDSASYTIEDYSAADGDAIIATRLSSVGDLTSDDISGTGNKVAFAGGKELTIGSNNGQDALHVKVAAMDNDANVLKARADVVLANGNGNVDASSAGSNGAMILAGKDRGEGVHNVIGSSGDDLIIIGANDSVDAGTGNDIITLESGASGAVVSFGSGKGKDTIYGWTEGFDRVKKGATKLDLDGENFGVTIIEDQIALTVGSGTIVFGDSYSQGDLQFDLLIDETKYTALRTGGVATISSNDEVADIYWAQSAGELIFTKDVTKNLGMIDLNDEGYQNINKLTLNNNSKASVMGTNGQDSVILGGDASIGAGKTVSLDAGNDILYSGGNDGASNTIYFGTGDGRDSIFGFNHYNGFENDPQKKSSDLLIVDNFLDVTTTTSDGMDRIIFKTSETDEIAIYETNPLDVDNNMYRVKINGFDETVAKIGYSTGGNTFTYSDEVKYYVGKSGTATDTLKLDDSAIDAEIWLDSTKNGEFYRGIGTIDAREVTGTHISLVGSMDNNTIYGGGEDTTTNMWGGAGDNVLVGGEGADVFMYYQYSRNYIDGAAGMANANRDTIQNYDFSKDVIYLGDLTIDDVNFEATKINDASIVVTMNNGGTLTVEGTQENTRFTFSNGDGEVGQVWRADRSSRSWSRES